MTNENKTTLLVTGASGHLGQRVVELLLEAGETSIVATTRTPEKLAHFSEQGVEVRSADFNDPASLPDAFAGVDRLLLISTDAVGEPGLRLKQHQNAISAAESAGVQHIVYTSLVNPGPESPILLAPDHDGTEKALEASSVGFTSLRNNVYAEMLLGSLPQAVQMGKLFSAGGDGKTSYVTREDCARAAAAALVSDFEGRRYLDITGPGALSQADLAAITSDLTETAVIYVPIDSDTLVQNMIGAGLPEPVAHLLASFDAAIAQGKLAVVSTAVSDLTGTPPQTVADFLAENKAVFAGDQA